MVGVAIGLVDEMLKQSMAGDATAGVLAADIAQAVQRVLPGLPDPFELGNPRGETAGQIEQAVARLRRTLPGGGAPLSDEQIADAVILSRELLGYTSRARTAQAGGELFERLIVPIVTGSVRPLAVTWAEKVVLSLVDEPIQRTTRLVQGQVGQFDVPSDVAAHAAGLLVRGTCGCRDHSLRTWILAGCTPPRRHFLTRAVMGTYAAAGAVQQGIVVRHGLLKQPLAFRRRSIVLGCRSCAADRFTELPMCRECYEKAERTRLWQPCPRCRDFHNCEVGHPYRIEASQIAAPRFFFLDQPWRLGGQSAAYRELSLLRECDGYVPDRSPCLDTRTTGPQRELIELLARVEDGALAVDDAAARLRVRVDGLMNDIEALKRFRRRTVETVKNGKFIVRLARLEHYVLAGVPSCACGGKLSQKLTTARFIVFD